MSQQSPWGEQNPYEVKTHGPQGPGGPGGRIPPGSVKTYLAESILLLICCAGIFAIPAIVFAAQVSGKLSAGDYQGAVQASNKAKTWCIIGLVIGLILNVASIFLAMALGLYDQPGGQF